VLVATKVWNFGKIYGVAYFSEGHPSLSMVRRARKFKVAKGTAITSFVRTGEGCPEELKSDESRLSLYGGGYVEDIIILSFASVGTRMRCGTE
jgi:hypothetical protein